MTTFLLLSPTYGMHLYTADLANRLAEAGERVHLLTTVGYPAHCYAPTVQVHTPVSTRNTGFSWRGLRPAPTKALMGVIQQVKPSLVHITGPHAWNPAILAALRRAGIPTVHTLHDLDPHPGSPYGALLRLWNALVIRRANVILVHAQRYRERLLCQGVLPEHIAYSPLLHGFWGYGAQDKAIALAASIGGDPSPMARSPSPIILFFGRLERYKGLDVLLHAWEYARPRLPQGAQLILAGRGDLKRLWNGPLPTDVEVRARHIADEEALDLFCRCALLVLPYIGATQSALVAAAYFFHKPVIVSRSGALPEYVDEGHTGWVVEPGDVKGLAGVLVEALSDPARLAEMGAAGRVWYERARKEEWETLISLYTKLGAT